MANPKTFHFKLTSANRPPDVKIPELWFPEIQRFIERSSSRRIVDPHFGIRAVVIHATAGSSSEGAVSVMRDGVASFHWLVPDENENAHGTTVWACIPETRAAHHVQSQASNPDINDGKSKVNHWSLGIEIVNTQAQNNPDPFSDWQVEVTSQIVRYCWAKYPNLTDVISHAKLDPRRRNDPGNNFPWNKFKELVLKSPVDASILSQIKGVKGASKIKPSKSKEEICS